MQSIPLEEYIALRRLLNCKHIGIVRLRSMIDAIGSGTQLIDTPPKNLLHIEKMTDLVIKGFIEGAKNGENDADYKKEYEYVTSISGSILAYGQPGYPSSLSNIYDPPVLLYVVGELTEQDKKSLAIVGSRTPSPYGLKTASDFSRDLVSEGFTVISGLARGIDTTAHKAALSAGGRTIAVLGSGFKNIYPSENKKLAKDISTSGAVITEFAPDTKPDAINFPARNRIISGLSLGSLIVETAEKGGALHTAAFAIDQGREVFAIPGNINSLKSGGTNRLIQDGNAKLVMNVADILIEFKIVPKSNPDPAPVLQLSDLSMFEEKIYTTIGFEPLHIDQISSLTGLNISECLINLLQLEFKGLVRQQPGKNFVRI
ncbi:MAG: DNA-protecting protein DprA [Ignavibacteriales bacterium]|jgi:DNA processing protein|nr:DNA-protecting protein DprA [Ignavibacteriales bacterium]